MVEIEYPIRSPRAEDLVQVALVFISSIFLDAE
jgi:hypothetical protein